MSRHLVMNLSDRDVSDVQIVGPITNTPHPELIMMSLFIQFAAIMTKQEIILLFIIFAK